MKKSKIIITILLGWTISVLPVLAQKSNKLSRDQIKDAARDYFATYVGGKGNEFCEAIALDEMGNVYIAGNTHAKDFPTTPGSYNSTPKGKGDVFIMKLDKELKIVLASTLIGGNENECAYSMLYDDKGYIYIAGYTDSKDFPTTTSSYCTNYKGGGGDGFIVKMDCDLKTIIGSTFIGGSGMENDHRSPEIAQDKSGNIYMAGITNSDDFPTTNGAFQEKYNGGAMDVFVSKFDPGLKHLLASTFVGGSSDDRMGRSLCIDFKNDEICIGGYLMQPQDFPVSKNAHNSKFGDGLDGFILKLTSDLTKMTASTILIGGWIYCMMIHENGDIYVGGHANGNLTTTSDAYYKTFDKHSDQGFISRLSNDLSELKSSTVLPGSWTSGGGAITSQNLTQTSEGDIISAGWARPKDFPVTPGAFDETQNGGGDLYILKMDKNLSKVLKSTFIGGKRSERWNRLTTDKNGNFYIASYTHSSDFPVSRGAAFENFHELIKDEEENLNTSPRDAFVVRINKNLSAITYEEFHEAAKNDDLKKVKKLLSKNNELLEKKDKYKRTALHSAARYGAVSVSEYLVAKGASLSTKDESGNTALHLASLYGKDDVVKLLLNYPNNINTVNEDGETALSLGAFYGTAKTIAFLLDKNADTGYRDNAGNTILHIAGIFGNVEKVKEIGKYMQNVDIRNKEGKTTFLLVAGNYYADLQLLEAILEQGADLFARDNAGKTALHIATNPAVIRELLKEGANINIQDNEGNTPLHSILNNLINFRLKELPVVWKERIQLYIEGGADLNLNNNSGKSALDLSVESGIKEVIDLLKTKK
ncbi:ankyrin repeat domain-containing protein [Bacteroidota bacterium]